MDNSVALTALGLVSAILVIVVKPLFSLLKENTTAQREQTQAMQALVKETRKGNEEAAARNGHLGEQNEHITALVVNHAKEAQALVETAAARVVEAIQHVDTQNVETLNVRTATVKEGIVKVPPKKG